MLMAPERKKPGRPRDPQSKRSLGEDRSGPRLTVTITASIDAAIDAYIQSKKDAGEAAPGRSAITVAALAEHLKRLGFYKD